MKPMDISSSVFLLHRLRAGVALADKLKVYHLPMTNGVRRHDFYSL